MENVEKIIYINLGKRQDRRAEIESEFARLGIPDWKILRFEAVEHANPVVGCSLSHAGVLTLAATLGLKNCLILEDDFNFVEDAGSVEQGLAAFFASEPAKKGEWNAIQLAHYVYEGESFNETLGIAHRSSNAAGYLVNGHLLSELAKSIGDAAHALEKTGAHWLYANDVVWCTYMKDRRWFYFKEPLGYQRTSYSNLSGQVVTRLRKL